MVEQQKQTTINDFFPVLAVEPSPQTKEMQILNLTTECRQWKNNFQKSEAKVVALEKEIRKIIEAKGVTEGKNSSARNLLQRYLMSSALTSETAEQFETILRVLKPDPDEFISKGQSGQQTAPPDNALSSVEAGSSLGVSNTGTPNDLDIPAVTRIKRRRVPVGSEVSQKKVCRKERLGCSSTLKIAMRNLTRKQSKKSSGTKAPLNSGEPSTGVVPSQTQTAHALLTSPSGLQSTTNTQNMEMSKSPSSDQQAICSQRDVSMAIYSVAPTPDSSGTLHLAKNGHEDVNEGSSLPSMTKLAVELFSKSLLIMYVDDDTKSIIEKLCIRLKLDAVALKLAVSCINGDLRVLSHPLKDIIENYFVKIDKETVRNDGKVPGLAETPCYLTWRLIWKKIREIPGIGEKALTVLEIISFLVADDMQTKFLWNLYTSIGNDDDPAIRENILQLLTRFFVINSDSGESISVHPLIQEAIRNDLEEQEKLIEILGRIQRGTHEMIKKNVISSEQMIYVKSIWQNVAKTADLIKEDGAFPSSICRQLIKLGKYREAFKFSCEVLPVLESTLGGKHRWTLAVKYWTGTALEKLGKYSNGLEVLTEVYESQKELFGDEDEDCLLTAGEIGIIHWRLEKYEEALKWNLNTLEKRERIFGKEHPKTLDLKHNVAGVLHGQEKYKEALELYEQVLEVRERLKGREDPSALNTKFSMAIVRFSQGNYEDALMMLQEVLEAEERVLEVDHPDTLTTKDWMANTYRCLGRKKDSGALYQEVCEKREKILGAEHPDALATKHNLAVSRFGQWKYKDALKLFQEVLELKERVFGADHLDTLTTKVFLADTYECLGKNVEAAERKMMNEKAAELYKEVLEKRQEILGPEHPDTLTTKHNLAVASFNQGMFEKALKLFQEVLEVEERLLKINHPDILTTKKWISRVAKKIKSGEKSE